VSLPDAASAIDAAGAGAGAVEAVRNAVVLPTPGTEAWWRAAVREAVYAPLEGPTQYVRETVNWTSLLKKGLGGLQLLQRLDPPPGRTKIKITAEVDGVRRDYKITYGRYGSNVARGFAYASASAPDGREADAEKFAAVIETWTGVKPKAHRMKNGKIIIECGRAHLEGFMSYAELADIIARWLEERGR